MELFYQIWTHGTLRHILGPILVIFEICYFLTISGLFESVSEKGSSKNQSFLDEGMMITALLV